jgi:voltage-gated potassium channel
LTGAQRIAAAAGLLAVLTLVGAAGYMAIESEGFFDSFYMTIITISTVGYGEIFELSTAGRLFSIVLVVLGVGLVFYTATATFEFAFERQPTRRIRALQKQIDGLSGHYIICGFGRVGRNAWRRIEGEGHDSVVLDNNPDRVQMATDMGALAIEGDATQNQALERAGISRAAGLIASVKLDSDNLVIVLSARSVNRDIMISARADTTESEDKLVLAGADRVVAPQVVGGHRLAELTVHREVADFVDLVHGGRHVEFKVEEFPLEDGASLVGLNLRQSEIRSRSGAMVFALEEPDGGLVVNPNPDIVFAPGCRLVAIGTDSQLQALRKMIEGSS